MVVMVLERVPQSLRGELTRWMLEVRTGVFIGTLSQAVRSRLWEKACAGMAGGAGTMICSARTEQGFEVCFWGDPSRSVIAFEGLQLVQTFVEP